LSHHNKRTKTGQVKTDVINTPTDQLEAQVRQALSKEQYKSAIQYLKLLVKQKGLFEQIRPLFQEAYAGRAGQLAAQGMVKEAAAIWEVAIPHGLDQADPRYIGWLVQTQQYSQLLDIYRKIPVENRHILQPLLAAALLSGAAASMLTALPDEDPVRTGYGPARQLLEAWCAGDGVEQLHERMKAISFRSPYRDLRQTIQAWLLLENAPEQAGEALERMAADSPFRPLAEQVRLAQLPLLELLPQLSALSPAARACQLEARGLSDSRLVNQLRDLERLPHDPSASQLFAFLTKFNPAQLTPSVRYWWRDAIKRAWVASSAPSMKKATTSSIEKVVGVLSSLETYHLDCLTCSVSHPPFPLLSMVWSGYRRELLLEPDAGHSDNGDDITPADRRLAAARINIYLASQWQQEEQGELTDKSVDLLRQSLQYDPGEQKVWGDVIAFYLQERALVKARNTLQEALEHHPNDTSLLELGVQVAVAGETFKKAAGYAKRILELDPINSRVRHYLQNAHISHARKQIRQKKWHLAHKELTEARQWKSTPLNATIIQILQTYLEHRDGQGMGIGQGRQGDVVQATRPQLLEDSGLHPAALDFLFRHECILVGLPLFAFHHLGPIDDPWKKADKQVVMALLDIAGQLLKASSKTLAACFDCLRAPLRKTARLPFTADEGEQLCEFWVRMKEEDLLLHYARRLQKTWPQKPIFTYYYYYYWESYDKNVISTLEKALKMAKSQGDEGLGNRIRLLQERIDRIAFNQNIDFFDDFFDDNFDDMDDDCKNSDENDMLSVIKEMADMAQIAPYKDVFKILCEMMGTKKARDIQERLGQKAVRDLCQAIMGGDDPDEIIAGMEDRPVKKKPVQGRLF